MIERLSAQSIRQVATNTLQKSFHHGNTEKNKRALPQLNTDENGQERIAATGSIALKATQCGFHGLERALTIVSVFRIFQNGTACYIMLRFVTLYGKIVLFMCHFVKKWQAAESLRNYRGPPKKSLPNYKDREIRFCDVSSVK